MRNARSSRGVLLFPHSAFCLPHSFCWPWPAAKERAIHQYAAPKPRRRKRSASSGVIYPHGDLTWFFKLMGPSRPVSAQAEAVNDFSSRSFHRPGRPADGMEAAEGLAAGRRRQGEQPRPLRTLRIESKDKPSLEMTVTKFPGNGRRPPGQRQPLGAARWVCRRSRRTNWTRTRGRKSSTATRRPSLKLVGPIEARSGAAVHEPARPRAGPDGHPLHQARRLAEDSDNLVVKGFRRAAAFKATEADGSVEIRWPPPAATCCRTSTAGGQVNLDPVTEDQVKDFPKVEAAGRLRAAHRHRRRGRPQTHCRGGGPHDGQTWFFKMEGPSPRWRSRNRDLTTS